MTCTAAVALVDTSVLVYRFDPRFPLKQERASLGRVMGADRPLWTLRQSSRWRLLLFSERRSAALNWEGVVPSHVRKAR